MRPETHFQNKLLTRRQEIMDSRQVHRQSWHTLHQNEVELEETAEKKQLARQLARLDEQEKDEIEAIDTALGKIETGHYGVCENCGKTIARQRLEAIPWSLQCYDCAREKKFPPQIQTGTPGEEPVHQPSPRVTDPEAEAMIYDELRRDGRVALDELLVKSQGGKVYLEGFLPSHMTHEILLSVVEDILGFQNIEDNIRIDRLAWERQNRTPGKAPAGKPDKEVLMEGEGPNEDVIKAQQNGTPVSPPDKMAPEEEA